MKEKQCNYVFVATEDKDILDVLKAEFGDKLLFLDQRRYSGKDMQSDQVLAQIKEKDKERNPIKDALDYLQPYTCLPVAAVSLEAVQEELREYYS